MCECTRARKRRERVLPSVRCPLRTHPSTQPPPTLAPQAQPGVRAHRGAALGWQRRPRRRREQPGAVPQGACAASALCACVRCTLLYCLVTGFFLLTHTCARSHSHASTPPRHTGVQGQADWGWRLHARERHARHRDGCVRGWVALTWPVQRATPANHAHRVSSCPAVTPRLPPPSHPQATATWWRSGACS